MTIWTDDNLSSETTGFLKLLDIISPISVSETVSANSFCFNCFFPDTGGKCAAHLNPLCAFFSHQAVAAVVAIEVTSVINLTQGGAGWSWKFVYQIYTPPIDTLVTGMVPPRQGQTL